MASMLKTNKILKMNCLTINLSTFWKFCLLNRVSILKDLFSANSEKFRDRKALVILVSHYGRNKYILKFASLVHSTRDL